MLCKIIINVTEQTAPKITKTLSLQTFTYLPPSTSEASIALDTGAKIMLQIDKIDKIHRV